MNDKQPNDLGPSMNVLKNSVDQKGSSVFQLRPIISHIWIEYRRLGCAILRVHIVQKSSQFVPITSS